MSEIDKEKMQETNRFALDPRVENELNDALSEQEIIGAYTTEGGDSDKVPLVRDFNPDKDEWGGKTIFERGQPRNVTLAANLTDAFPVLAPSEGLIEQVVSDYEMRLTSVEGISRTQITNILRALFGGGVENDGDAPNAIQLALSAGPEDND